MSELIIVVKDNPAQVDWTVRRGNTLLRYFNIKEEDADCILQLVDLTGSTFSMVITDNRGASVDTLTLGDGITVVSEGRVQVHRAASVTADWPADCAAQFVFTWTRPSDPVVVKDIVIGKV